MWRKVPGLLFFLSAAVAAGLLFGLLLGRFVLPARPAAPPPTAVLLKEIQGLGELATVKYVLEQVVVVEDPAWYGDNRVILVAHGVVKAGLDLGDLGEADVRVDGRVLRVRLPRFRIMDVYLDEQRTRVVERTTGLLRFFDKGMEQKARQEAVQGFRSRALQGGILREAEAQARTQLEAFGRRMGFERVEFEGRAP